MTLRYGENPSQRAALYVTEEPRGMRDLDAAAGQGTFLQQHSGPGRGDVDRLAAGARASPARSSSTRRRAAIALAGTAEEAFRQARACDPQSAFGGVVAFNTVVTARRPRREGPVRRGGRGAVVPRRRDAVFATKKNLRVVELPVVPAPAGSTSSGCGAASWCRTASSRPGRGRAGPSRPRARPASRSWCDSALRVGRRSRRSSRTRSCWPATNRPSASAPAR